MKKLHETYDFFTGDDIQKKKLAFECCHKIALACGLECMCYIGDWHRPELHLKGTKWKFLKYYYKTSVKTGDTGGLKRFLSVFLW